MSVGIKIRALDNTTFIGASDVFIVDTPNPIDTGLSYTKNVKYSDLISQLNTDLEIPDSGGAVSDILLLTQGETIVLKVTVGPKTIYNRHYTESPDVCYYINGEESPAIIMSPNRTYRFDLSEVPDSYDFFLYNDRDSSFFAIPEVTFGENFLEYKAINRYERVYYSGERFSYMGNIMYNMDAETTLGPTDSIRIEVEKISGIQTKLDQMEISHNNDLQNVQTDANTLQSTQTNNNQTLLTHTSDIGDLEVEVSNLKNQIASMNNLISQMNNHLTELGIVIETE